MDGNDDCPWRLESLIDFTTNDTSSPQFLSVPVVQMQYATLNSYFLAVLPMYVAT